MGMFGTAGIRGPVADRLTPALALAVGQAVGRLAVEAESVSNDAESNDVASNHIASPPEIVVGRDGRLTGPALVSAVEAGVSAAGGSAVRSGVVPTPTLAFASRGRYGIMLTASHNPPADNGIKLFVDGREFDSEREQQIERALETTFEANRSPATAPWEQWQTPRKVDPIGDYRSAVIDYAQQILTEDASTKSTSPCVGLRVAVDCGNGMAARATPQVLRELGAHVVTLNGNIDGHFPGRPSKPTPETIGDLRRFVAAGDFDVGIAHDGDADRIVLLDSDGDVVHEDTVLAILAGYYTRASQRESNSPLSTATAEPVVVTTPNASGRIDEQVRAAGGRVERVQLGGLHEGIAAVEDADGDGDVVFAAEPWKHIHPAFGGWTDGILSAAVCCQLISQTSLRALREPITERPYRKVSIDCPDAAKSAAMTRVETSLPAAFPAGTVTREHGIRLDFDDGSWFLIRPSGTEPYLRLYAESDTVDELVSTATGCIETAVDTAQSDQK